MARACDKGQVAVCVPQVHVHAGHPRDGARVAGGRAGDELGAAAGVVPLKAVLVECHHGIQDDDQLQEQEHGAARPGSLEVVFHHGVGGQEAEGHQARPTEELECPAPALEQASPAAGVPHAQRQRTHGAEEQTRAQAGTRTGGRAMASQ